MASAHEATVRQRVLILGAGLVSAPVIEYLNRDKSIQLIVCSHLKAESDRLAAQYPGVTSIELNVVKNGEELRRYCAESDLVISLLPYNLHSIVAEQCINARTHMITPSYVSPKLKQLNER